MLCLVRMGMVAWNVSFQFSLNNLHLADVRILPKNGPNAGTKTLSVGEGRAEKGITIRLTNNVYNALVKLHQH